MRRLLCWLYGHDYKLHVEDLGRYYYRCGRCSRLWGKPVIDALDKLRRMA